MVTQKLTIVPMLPNHIKRVYRIETLVSQHPWNIVSFYDCLKFAHYSLVLIQGRKVLGFFIADNSIEEIHILNFAIHPKVQQQGLGKMLLKYALQELYQLGGKEIYLEVRKFNNSAQQLYKQQGFKQIGIRKEYYPSLFDKREDAIVLKLTYEKTKKHS